LDAAAVMDVMAPALDDVEAGGVQMPVLLAVGARGVGLDVAFDGLGDLGGGARRDGMLAEEVRSALPGDVLGADDAGRLQELLGEVRVSAFQGPHEGALLLPALPHDGNVLIVLRAGNGFVGPGFSRFAHIMSLWDLDEVFSGPVPAASSERMGTIE